MSGARNAEYYTNDLDPDTQTAGIRYRGHLFSFFSLHARVQIQENLRAGGAKTKSRPPLELYLSKPIDRDNRRQIRPIAKASDIYAYTYFF